MADKVQTYRLRLEELAPWVFVQPKFSRYLWTPWSPG